MLVIQTLIIIVIDSLINTMPYKVVHRKVIGGDLRRIEYNRIRDRSSEILARKSISTWIHRVDGRQNKQTKKKSLFEQHAMRST